MFTKITKPPAGITENCWLDVTNEEHHKMSCISSSHLKYFKSLKLDNDGNILDGNSFKSYLHKFIFKATPPEIKDEFRVGTLAHLAVLEPEKFKNCVIESDLDQRTTEFKEYEESLAKKVEMTPEKLQEKKAMESLIEMLQSQLDASGISKEDEKATKKKIKEGKKRLSDLQKTEKEIQYTKDGGFIAEDGTERFIVTCKEMAMYKAFQKQFEEHSRISLLMTDCIIEQSGVAQDPHTGLWLSVRGDARSPRGFFLDPKSISDDLSYDSISRYCHNFGLALQAAHYLETANLIDGVPFDKDAYTKFFFVFMSKKPPFEIALTQLDEEAMNWGLRKRREILNLLAECEAAGRFPTLDTNRKTQDRGIIISLPPWGLK